MRDKIRFGIIGSGWRSLYYVRICKRLPEIFDEPVMLCRREEKKKEIEEKYGIRCTLSEEDIIAYEPDFLVAAVKKDKVAETSLYWLDKGYPVLAETPCALDKETITKLKEAHEQGKKLLIAEQYRLYPQNMARKEIVHRGLIGEPHYLYLSLAHEYHGISLMRYFLDIPAGMKYTIHAREYSFPVTETRTRYEEYRDGRATMKKRVIAEFEFENGKVCLYDFDSEQYRSSIRSLSYHLYGLRGEIRDDEVSWLDIANYPQKEKLDIRMMIETFDEENPNLRTVKEITEIRLKDEILYDPPFRLCGLSDDETALALFLQGMDRYVRGGEAPYPLEEALCDASMAIDLRETLQKENERH